MAHVPHLFVAPPWPDPGDAPALPLTDEQRHHLAKVLRRADDAPITYTDGAGRFGDGIFVDGLVRRGAERQVAAPRPVRIAVAPPKAADRCRWIVEKLQELAVSELIWIDTVHGQGRPPKADKARRWAVGALEQSRGTWLMGIDSAGDLKNLEGSFVVADQAGGTRGVVTSDDPVTIAIGPEGGWAPGEIPGDNPVICLADTVLRTETAAIAAAVVARTFSGSEGR